VGLRGEEAEEWRKYANSEPDESPEGWRRRRHLGSIVIKINPMFADPYCDFFLARHVHVWSEAMAVDIEGSR
jgi:hypothetical protein